MKKIIVIGCPGSGKSTVSRALHNQTGIPLYHLDMMYWNADKTNVDESMFLARVSYALAQESWIIDGNYAASLELRMQSCDTVIFLDYSVETCLEGIAARKGKVRTDIPWVETEDDLEFLDFVRSYPVLVRPNVLTLLEKYADKEIHIFRTRQDADVFLSQI